METRNPRRFLEELAALDGLGGNNRADLTLANEGGGVGAGRRIREEQGDVLGTNVAAVDPIGRARAALDPPSDLAFAGALVVVLMFDQDRHFGEVAGRTRRGSGEDHVVHAAAAKAFGAGLAHRPADRLQQVGFAAAVGADDAG